MKNTSIIQYIGTAVVTLIAVFATAGIDNFWIRLVAGLAIACLGVAGKDVVDVGAAVAVMGDSSAAQTALEVGGPQARPLISC